MLRITALSLLSLVLMALAIYFRPRKRWVIKAWSEDGTCYATVQDGVVWSWEIGHRTDATLFRSREAAYEIVKRYKRHGSDIEQVRVAQIDATRRLPRFFTLAEMMAEELEHERVFGGLSDAELLQLERSTKWRVVLYRALGKLFRQYNPYAQRNVVAAMVRDFN